MEYSIALKMIKPSVRANKDLVPQRREQLRAILRERGIIRIDELCKQLGASPATVRRDLNELENLGELQRVHGGAVNLSSRLEEPLFQEKAAKAVKEKQRIAQEAFKLIEKGDTIYLDGGSTLVELARLLRNRNDITVVTNSLSAAQELSGQGPRLIMIGGELRRVSQALVGPLTRLILNTLFIEKAFVGTLGLSLQEGITTTDPNEAFTKEVVFGRSRRVIVLADHSKIGKDLFARSGSLENIHVLITDRQLDSRLAKQFSRKDIQVIHP